LQGRKEKEKYSLKEPIEIIFPFATPTGWKFKGHYGWRALMGWNKKCDRYLDGYETVKKWQAKGRRKVTITRHHKNKRDRIKDDVNLREGCKPLIDALDRKGLLFKDTTEYLNDVYYQKITKKEPFTHVKIEDV